MSDACIEYLKSRWPHGSGFNDVPEFDTLKNGKIVVKGGFHCMNDAGYYDGWVEYRVKFDPRESMAEFKLSFSSRTNHRQRKYLLREFIDDTIFGCLEMAVYTEPLEVLGKRFANSLR